MRYTVTRALLHAAGGIALASIKLLPRDHPARSFYEGRVRQALTLHYTVVAPKGARSTAIAARVICAGGLAVSIVSVLHTEGLL